MLVGCYYDFSDNEGDIASIRYNDFPTRDCAEFCGWRASLTSLGRILRT